VTDTQQFLQLAIRQINIGNPGAAILPLHRVLAADPQHPLAHSHLAHCLRDTGQAAEARREIATALALSPENAYTRRIAGVVAIDGGEFHEAEDHLNAARLLNPRDPWVYRWLARLYRRTGRSHLAVTILEDGLQQVPDNAGLMGALASLLLAGGETRQAAHAAAATLQLDPESADAHSVLGTIRLFDGDTARASEHALLALRRDPDHVRANRLHRLLELKRNPVFGLCWLIVVWAHRATKRSSAAIVRYAFIFILVVAGVLARGWGGNLFGASLLVLLLGLALAMKLLERALRRTFAQVRLSADF
jgi:Flp pilus assembly protein TadD